MTLQLRGRTVETLETILESGGRLRINARKKEVAMLVRLARAAAFGRSRLEVYGCEAHSGEVLQEIAAAGAGCVVLEDAQVEIGSGHAPGSGLCRKSGAG